MIPIFCILEQEITKSYMHDHPVVTFDPTRHLKSLHREIHARNSAFVVVDQVAGTLVVCCQRLPLAAAYLNQFGGDRVSVASLYEAAALGRRVHRRWSCRRMSLEDAPCAFEEARKQFPGAKAVAILHPMRLAME